MSLEPFQHAGEAMARMVGTLAFIAFVLWLGWLLLNRDENSR